jgi:hypothetical protein
MVSDPERQPEAGAPRPWEEPGAVRRDVASHRAELLRWLANVSLACSVAALLLGAPAVVGVPLAVVTLVMADRDLEKMGGGQLDPRGRKETYAASRRAGNALALGLAAPVVCPLLWCGCFSVLVPILEWVAAPAI